MLFDSGKNELVLCCVDHNYLYLRIFSIVCVVECAYTFAVNMLKQNVCICACVRAHFIAAHTKTGLSSLVSSAF